MAPKTRFGFKQRIRVLITCFDVSGDHHCAELIKYARKHHPNLQFVVSAGEKVAELVYGSDNSGKRYKLGKSVQSKQQSNSLSKPQKITDSIELLESQVMDSSIGILEGIPYVLSTLRFFIWFKRYLKANPVDLLLCIDGQGRNIKLGEIAHSLGIKTAYYFPPQVSVFGKWNAKKLQKFFDLLICPFETDHRIYLEAGNHSIFIGHPFGLLKPPSESRKTTLRKKLLGRNSASRLISLFPGSRFQEIKNILPIFLKSSLKLSEQFPDLSFVISCSHQTFQPMIEKMVAEYWASRRKEQSGGRTKPKMGIVHGQWDNILEASDFILACSGTVTLKASFLGVPHVICYKISWLSYWIARIAVRVNYIGMANILANREICKELINNNLSVNSLTGHVEQFLLNDRKYAALKSEIVEAAKSWRTKDPFKIIFSEILNLFKKPN